MNKVNKGSKTRISRDLARSTKMCGSTVGKFGWQLAQKVYLIEETISSNYAGRGKTSLVPKTEVGYRRCREGKLWQQPRIYMSSKKS